VWTRAKGFGPAYLGFRCVKWAGLSKKWLRDIIQFWIEYNV
jgi:hypothetical protein